MPGPARSSSLRQLGEDGRRIALGGRRLAGGEADLALRHGKARDAVDEAEHVAARGRGRYSAMRERQIGRLAAHQRRFVRGRDDDDAARQALGPEIVLDEFLHFAAALADQPDHRRVGGGVARDHRQQHRLADAGAGEDAHALAAAAGQKGVDGAHAEIDLALDALARMGRRRLVAQRIGGAAARQRALAVDRLAQRVDDAAEPAVVRIDRRRPVGELDLAAEADRRRASPNGISSARPSRKPTTSQATRRPSWASTSQRPPTARLLRQAADLEQHAHARR